MSALGDLSIFVHDKLKLLKRLESPFSDYLESIAAEIQIKNVKLAVMEVYCPPNTDDQKFL